MLKKQTTTATIRAGDRVAVWGDVMSSPRGPVAVFAGVQVPMDHLKVADHWKRIQAGDKVTAPGFTRDEYATVSALVDARGAILPAGVHGDLALVSQTTDGALPRIVPVDQLTRLD